MANTDGCRMRTRAATGCILAPRCSVAGKGKDAEPSPTLSSHNTALFLYNLFFGVPLSQLSQPCPATAGNHDKQKVFPAVLHNYLRSKTVQKGSKTEILFCHVKRPLRIAGY